MGNETTRPSLKLQKPSLSLEAPSSISRSEYNTAWSGLSAITPEEPSSSKTIGGDVPLQFNVINGTNVNSLTANIHSNYSNTNTLGFTSINVSTLSLDNSQQSSNSSTCNGYNIPKLTPLELSATDSLSYSQRLGIAADQPIPSSMMNDEEIYHKNHGRKSISEKKKKKKKRIFTFNKNKTIIHDNDCKDNGSNIANDASRRPSVARSRARPNAKRKPSLNYINHKPRSQHKVPKFSKNVTRSHKSKTRHSKNINDNNTKRRKSIANSKVDNGITGKYISEKIANCAALFWVQNIDVLKRKDQLEIGCLQYFYLLEQYPEVKQFFAKDKIEETALRYFMY